MEVQLAGCIVYRCWWIDEGPKIFSPKFWDACLHLPKISVTPANKCPVLMTANLCDVHARVSCLLVFLGTHLSRVKRRVTRWRLYIVLDPLSMRVLVTSTPLGGCCALLAEHKNKCACKLLQKGTLPLCTCLFLLDITRKE
jgi:hypothetical protein